ncbi:MAG: glycosyltransferase family 9 protein [Deltaproteobacteria bacterium]|nr:glycosyltransferase family 9 protein [Deltaproteobacteria bacterium]
MLNLFDKIRQRGERLGREFLVRLVGKIFGVKKRPVKLGPRPRILIVRLDERVGNLVLTSPILSSLRLRFANAQIDLLAHYRGAEFMAKHAAINNYFIFDKRRWFARHGPIFTPFFLRSKRYDVAIDAANPSDPSATQAIFVRLCGAKHTVGYAEGKFARLYSAPVIRLASASNKLIKNNNDSISSVHEIDMRLALLQALPGAAIERNTSLANLGSDNIKRKRPYGIMNVGARLGEKRLSKEAYINIAKKILSYGIDCIVVYGPSEFDLANEVATSAIGAELAPPTTLVELAQLMQNARIVITCDTGPMHIAVALGVATCGLFLVTEPSRYGYNHAPHIAIDTRIDSMKNWLAQIDTWLHQRLSKTNRLL